MHTTRYNNFDQSAISFGREIRKKFKNEGKKVKKIIYYHDKNKKWTEASIYYTEEV